MQIKRVLMLALITCAAAMAAKASKPTDPYANVPADKREGLRTRLSEYVNQYRDRNWGKLYELVSDTGRGDVTRQAFTSRMEAAHGLSFANYPDLLAFVPARGDKTGDGGFDFYGCGEAQREGEKYKGVAVVHAIFEHENWFFVGWSFDGMANGSCSALNKPDWQPSNRLIWNHIMEELR
ncbi:MAG TPA: hypothetical protein VMI10_10830 [Terriglobales bacterium]|nr:hypothetical protein [Terriglobales bacterium]